MIYINQMIGHMNWQRIKISVIYFNQYTDAIINFKKSIWNAIRINHRSKISLSNLMGIAPISSILSIVLPYYTNSDINAVLLS